MMSHYDVEYSLLFVAYWPTTRIPWCISSYGKDLTILEQNEAIRWALQVLETNHHISQIWLTVGIKTNDFWKKS